MPTANEHRASPQVKMLHTNHHLCTYPDCPIARERTPPKHVLHHQPLGCKLTPIPASINMVISSTIAARSLALRSFSSDEFKIQQRNTIKPPERQE